MKFSMRKAAGVALCALLAVILPLTAIAATFTIDLEQEILFEDEGTRVTYATEATPDEFIGQECSVTAQGNNNSSVHPGNDLEVSSVNAVILEGVEDSEAKVTTAEGVLELGETISFTLIMGPDEVYSAALRITFDCQPPATTTTTTEPPTTTTTEPPTTTTEPPPTTTEPPTTTTTEPPTTTTTPPEATTTTSEPEVSPTTVAQTSTTEETDDTDETLPFTGADTDDMARVAYVALALGAGLLLLTRRSVEED